MYLTKEERGTFQQFLLLYLGSSFILFAIIAYLFYSNESRYFYEQNKKEMQIEADNLSAQIIHAHMNATPLSLNNIVRNFSDKIGFYDKENHPIASNIENSIDFSKIFYRDKDKMRLVAQSTFGHLRVESIVIQKEDIAKYINNLKLKITIGLLVIYLLLSIIGYFLARLFIKPIQMKRLQLDNFIKDSTHELNTPITALMLSINAPKLESPKNLERIKLSATRISEIYKDLTYLMLDKEREEIPLSPLFLNQILKKELIYLTLLAEKKRIDIKLNEENEIYFKIDKESFIRLIHNLVSNAIKYNTVNGYIKITIKKNHLIIRDSGIGISEKYHAEIYDRFYRATEQVGGFGLGLNIVHKVCQAYHISIDFESQLNRGTTFILTFNQ